MTKLSILTFILATALGARVSRADDNADLKKFLAFMDKITDAVVADKDTCPKMATDINSLIDANNEVIEIGKKAAAAGKQMPADAQKHVQDDVKRMMPGLQNCGQNKDVQAAFGRLNFGPKHAPPPAK
ncbi:MAG TPA: hypothetical protein VGF94_17375 [Kofleriaceae bacterium]|jgi:hypothetical protein